MSAVPANELGFGYAYHNRHCDVQIGPSALAHLLIGQSFSRHRQDFEERKKAPAATP